jgi:hypothetical protein
VDRQSRTRLEKPKLKARSSNQAQNGKPQFRLGFELWAFF